MMKPILCFFIKPSDRSYQWLRCSRSGPCPSMGGDYSYHSALNRVEDGVISAEDKARGILGGHGDMTPFAEDTRWPAQCSCGLAFEKKDRELFWEVIYQDDKGGEYHLHLSELPGGPVRAPAGAMWDASWWRGSDGKKDKFTGADGICLYVRCPSDPSGEGPDISDWFIDGPSISSGSNPAWSRKGTVPRVTVKPSIFIAPSRPGFHGWLHRGFIRHVNDADPQQDDL